MDATRRPVVLVVDDDTDTRDVLCMWLDCCGFRGVDAGDAASVLARVAEEVPDAILLDLGLPDIDGFEVCRRLRQNPATQSTPIIVLTGYASPTDTRRALDAGCDAVFVKPAAPERLALELQRRLPSFFPPAGR
jgi:CheY-like chemotaxis protein